MNITSGQRVITFLYCSATALVCLRAPWHVRLADMPEWNRGSRWIWATGREGSVDFGQLLARVLAVTALCSAILLLHQLISQHRPVTLFTIGAALLGVLSYWGWTVEASNHRAERVHNCAIARVASAKCSSAKGVSISPPPGFTEEVLPTRGRHDPRSMSKFQVDEPQFEICDPNALPDNATPEQEGQAFRVAEKECLSEVDTPLTPSIHEELVDYRRKHQTDQK